MMTGLGMGLLGLANSNLAGFGQMTHEGDTEALKNFKGALPLISVLLSAVGYQFGLSTITWSYAGN
jgi:hypothetical protein